MLPSKRVLEQPISNPKNMPWTLNQQIYNTKIKISKHNNQTKKNLKKWLNSINFQYD